MNPAFTAEEEAFRAEVVAFLADYRDLDAFFRFVEAVFQFRRKQLGGALGRISGISSTEAAARLRDAGIDPQRRPQTLSLTEWEAIFGSFAATGR